MENNSSWDADEGILRFLQFTGFANVTWGHVIMLVVGLFFIFLAIRFDYEPLLLIPIGVGVVIGNIPFMLDAGLKLGVY
ncbi:MAG: sodium ion-translocating decarboxylase subunit beta, partial [Bacteroidales bacterium]|nr:sodium ion-translocating decarboxylase subunit beta [Bacteroidales bacterium]